MTERKKIGSQWHGPIVALEYLWWGVSIGGRHYTGKIQADGKSVELVRKLSRHEAKEQAERDGRMWLARETETNKFETLASLERAASRWCEENLPADWLLLEHDSNNPRRPIAAAGYFKSRVLMISKLAAAWDKVPDSKREKLWTEVYGAWNALIRPNHD